MPERKIKKSKWYVIRWERDAFLGGVKSVTVLPWPEQVTERKAYALMHEKDEDGNTRRKTEYRGVSGRFHFSPWKGDRILNLKARHPTAVKFEDEPDVDKQAGSAGKAMICTRCYRETLGRFPSDLSLTPEAVFDLCANWRCDDCMALEGEESNV